jgi:hypothetical protein
LHESGVAMLASDNISDVQPSGIDSVRLPVHSVGLVGMGLWLLDNAFLEPLASRCAERDAWDFLFACLPLRLQRATGSPVNPVAIL